MDQLHQDVVLPAGGLPIAAELYDDVGARPARTSGCVQLTLVTGGTARCALGESERRVARGYLAMLAPGQQYEWREVQDLRVWTAYFGEGLLARELTWFDVGVIGRGALHARGRRWVERWLSPRSVDRAERWLAVVPPRTADGPAADGLRLAGLSGVLGEVARPPGRRSGALSPGGRDHEVVSNAVRRLEQDLSRPWTVATLAETVHVSPSSLTHAFSRVLDRAPMAHLARLRAARVASDLLSDDAPVSEIGRRYGWADPAYLSRRFRHFFGVPPSAYRELNAIPPAWGSGLEG